MWRDPEPFEGDITGLQILYLIDCVPQNIPELDGDANQFSVSGIKGSEGKTHSISLRARTTAGWGNYSTPVEFLFRPIGEIEIDGMDHVGKFGWERQCDTSCMPCLHVYVFHTAHTL